LSSDLDDLAFQQLNPRAYAQIDAMVNQPRADRELLVEEAGRSLAVALESADIRAAVSGHTRNLHSIYEEMARRRREFNEIYDLNALDVLVQREGREGERDCYGTVGVIHSLWTPLPGRFRDYVAMPRFDTYRSLHTTVIGPEGRPLEIRVRTREMDERLGAEDPEP